MRNLLFSLFLVSFVASKPLETQDYSYNVTYGYALDFSAQSTISQMRCLKSSRYNTVFIRAFDPTGQGSFDKNCVSSIRNAYSAGLGIEVYVTPQPFSNLTGYQQLDIVFAGLYKAGISVHTIWISVVSPDNWPYIFSTNENLLLSMIGRARELGVTVGIYTSSFDWGRITNNWLGVGQDVLLWYQHVYTPGVTGETQPNFDDFAYFGAWKTPTVKQFATSEIVCELSVNRNVYAMGKFSLPSSSDKIVIGSIGL